MADPNWRTVTCIDDFYRGEELGKGAYGIVERMICKKNNIEVAVKTIDKKAAYAAKMLDRIDNERRIHSRLDHPAIVKLHTSFEDSNKVYLVMELCEKGDLMSYMKKQGSFTESKAKVILRNIIEGLMYLHSKHVIHRDLKLANILLTKSWGIKIADFGLSCSIMADETHNTVCGTPNYMSPEVVTRSSQGFATDVYSLGCVLYTLLVGRPPFDSESTAAVMTKQTISDPEVPSDISLEARNLILQMLKKDSRERITLKRIRERLPNWRTVCDVSDIKSYDSGVGSSGIPSLAGSVASGRSSQSGFKRQSRPCSRVDLRENRESNDMPIKHDVNAMPRFGKSPPVRLTSNSTNALRAKMRMITPPCPLSSDFFDNSNAENVYPNNVGRERDISGERQRQQRLREREISEERQRQQRLREREISEERQRQQRLRERDISEERQRQQRLREGSSSPCRRGMNLQNRDCSPCGDRSSCGNNHSGQFSHHHHCSSNSLGPHVNAVVERSSCCSQCTDTYQCGRDHCKQQPSSCCPRNINTHRNHSVPPNCCRHNVRNGDGCEQCISHASCSHYGQCDLLRCTHADVCHCRTPATNQCPDYLLSENYHPVQEHLENVASKKVCSPVSNPSKKVRGGQINPLKCLNTRRLQPIRKVYHDNVAHILPGGDVCLERTTPYKGKQKVTYVYRITQDGMRIVVYKPSHHNAFLENTPPPIPSKGADLIFGYETLNDKNAAKHRRVYEYAATFVDAVKAKTVKICYHMMLGKCMLMENGNFEFEFLDDSKKTVAFKILREVKKPGVLKITHPNKQRSDLVLKDDDALVKEDFGVQVEHFLKYEKICKDLEKTHENYFQEVDLDPFPIVYRRAVNTASKSAKGNDKSTKANASPSTTAANFPSVMTNGSNAASQSRSKQASEKRISESDVMMKTSSKRLSPSAISLKSEPMTSSASSWHKALQEKRNSSSARREPDSSQVLCNKASPISQYSTSVSPEVSLSIPDISMQYRLLNVDKVRSAASLSSSSSNRSAKNNENQAALTNVRGVGTLTQFFIEGVPCIEMQYLDGSALKVLSGNKGIYYTDKNGVVERFSYDSVPKSLLDKVQKLQKICSRPVQDDSKRSVLRELPIF